MRIILDPYYQKAFVQELHSFQLTKILLYGLKILLKEIQKSSSYQYFRYDSFGEGTYTSGVSLPDGSASFSCNTPRNNSSWDIPIYFSDSRDGKSGKFENRPNTRKALSRCSKIEYLDQFEFEIAKAKILSKGCGSEPSDICFLTVFLPSIEDLPRVED